VVGKPYVAPLQRPDDERVEQAVEVAIVLGAGAVAVSLANERDPVVARWWLDRIVGAVRIENERQQKWG
jgi:hypothetical protein